MTKRRFAAALCYIMAPVAAYSCWNTLHIHAPGLRIGDGLAFLAAMLAFVCCVDAGTIRLIPPADSAE